MSAFFGTLAYFEHLWWVAAFWILLHGLSCWRRALLQAAATLLFFIYCSLLFTSSPTPGTGRALFAIHSVQRSSSPFNQGWLYKGTLRAFSSPCWAASVPCTVVYRGAPHDRPPANCDYLLEGTLRERDRFSFSFKPTRWQRVENTYSLAELRMRVKEKIHTLLLHRMERRAADFLTALFTGEIDDRSLRFEFGRLGLQHILAISGFHFALIAAFVATLLRPLFSYRPRLFALLATATLYFILVGNSPPVLRSFLAAALYLTGHLLHRRSSGLNLLGACLLFELLLNPLAALQIGFQLSFLSCGAILLLYPLVRRALTPLLPQRSLAEASRLTIPSQCAHISISFFTRALSLTLAVNVALCPLLLFHFHKFPFLSLLYNLFVPALSALCLLLLVAALLLHPLSPLLALPWFKLSSTLATHLLEVIAYPPTLLDASLSFAFPPWALAPWLFALFLAGIFFQEPPLLFSRFLGQNDVHSHGDRSSVG